MGYEVSKRQVGGMWIHLAYAAGIGVLLVSNMWLLREVETLKHQLEAYQREVASLDERVCQLMYAVEASREVGPQLDSTVRGR